MKKKITQWFCGLMICIMGCCVGGAGVCAVEGFIGMMNNTGKEFIGYFAEFIIMLLVFIFIPYVIFHIMKDGVRDKFK